MTDQAPPTPFQLLREFRRITSIQVTLGRYDEVQALEVTDQSVTLLLTVRKFTERAHEDKITGEGMRMISVNLTTGKRREITSWDESYQPKIARHLGSVTTAEEWYDKRDWEALCHRAGNGTRLGQRDNVGRQTQEVEWRLESMLYTRSESDTTES